MTSFAFKGNLGLFLLDGSFFQAEKLPLFYLKCNTELIRINVPLYNLLIRISLPVGMTVVVYIKLQEGMNSSGLVYSRKKSIFELAFKNKFYLHQILASSCQEKQKKKRAKLGPTPSKYNKVFGFLGFSPFLQVLVWFLFPSGRRWLTQKENGFLRRGGAWMVMTSPNYGEKLKGKEYKI